MNDWIQTYTGEKFYPLRPDSSSISIVDIAHSLSLLCRFNGHCTRFYSVAEHSIHVSNHCSDPLYGLLHDATEAYLSDVPRPIKPELTGYKDIESLMMDAVVAKFGLNKTPPPDLKEVDMAMLATEKEQLMVDGPGKWLPMPNPYTDVPYLGLVPHVAEARFLGLFEKLMSQKGEPK